MMSSISGCGCLEYAGLILVVYTLLKIVVSLWNFVNTYFLGSYPDFKKYGDWSVITGATDGIGLAFANELAKCGQNVVLISRSKDKLIQVSEEIAQKHKVQTKTVAVDFSKSDIYDTIAAELNGLSVAVLINNVGVGFAFPEFFVNIDNLPTVIEKMIAINITAAVKMTELVLPIMAAKKKGIILNISSGAAAKPTPLLSLYSASKQFVDCFSKTLSQEYANQGVIVQCIMPYYVTTKLSKIRRSSLFVPTPEKFVSSTLKTIGKAKRTHGYFAHALEAMLYSVLPESVYMRAAMKANLSIRKRALKKISEKKE